MRRPVPLILSLLVVGVLAYLAYTYRSDFGLGRPDSSAGNGAAWPANPDLQPGRVTWLTVDRSADGFKVDLPAGVSQTQILAYTEAGVAEPVNMIQASVDPETTYAVAWADNPPVERAGDADIEKILTMARDGALGRTQTTLLLESRENRNGYPAREILGRNAHGGILNARLILAGTRLYMLIAAFPAETARNEADVRHFFESFSLTAAAPTSR